MVHEPAPEYAIELHVTKTDLLNLIFAVQQCQTHEHALPLVRSMDKMDAQLQAQRRLLLSP